MSRALTIGALAAHVLAVPAIAQHLAVVSRGSGALVLHDVTTGHEAARFEVGDFPHEVVVDGTGRYAFVAAYGGQTVHAVDLLARNTRTFVLDGHRDLHGLAVGPQGDVVWVTAEESRAILEIETATGGIVRVWPTRGERSHTVAATPDGRKLYVPNLGSGTVSVIDRTTGSTTLVETGAGPEGIDVSPDGTEAWVSNRDDATLSILDTATDRVVATVGSGGAFPVKVRFHPGGSEVWVANNRSETVAVFDRRNRRLAATIHVGVRPLGLAFGPDGRRAFVTRPGADEVVEIDVSTRAIVRRIETGDGPDGIAWVP